ncbi:hypothetical protein [Microlunatus ginsengisoli]
MSMTDPDGSAVAATEPATGYEDAARQYAGSRGPSVQQAAVVQHARLPRFGVVAAIVLGLVANAAVALTQLLPSSAETGIVLGIIVVVSLGAGGLACRGVGELLNSPGWKASGCFLCAAAYLGTATVALVNGVPLIFDT